jgi:hypothetical protein
MNRYFDKGDSPRPEAYKEDYALHKIKRARKKKFTKTCVLQQNPDGISAAAGLKTEKTFQPFIPQISFL